MRPRKPTIPTLCGKPIAGRRLLVELGKGRADGPRSESVLRHVQRSITHFLRTRSAILQCDSGTARPSPDSVHRLGLNWIVLEAKVHTMSTEKGLRVDIGIRLLKYFGSNQGIVGSIGAQVAQVPSAEKLLVRYIQEAMRFISKDLGSALRHHSKTHAHLE